MVERQVNARRGIRAWLAFTAAVCVAYGVAAVVEPGELNSLYGTETDEGGLLWARFYGGAILFAGFVSWFARGSESLHTLRFVTLSLLLMFSVNLGVSIHALTQDLMNALEWTTIAGQMLLIGVWAYYRFIVLREPQESPASEAL
jgi:hypothetical protein